MSSNIKFSFLLLILIASPLLVSADIIFTRNLFLGLSGQDVKLLQQTLNRDSETKIADIGPGSLGQETEYFGNLTKIAVEKFQLKYAEYILKPANLIYPTGFVGYLTRDFLNKLIQQESESEMGTGSENINLEKATSSESKPISKNNSSNKENVTDKNSENPNEITAQEITQRLKDSFYAVTEKQKKEISDFTGIKYQDSEFSFSGLSFDFLKTLPFFSKTVQVYNAEPFQAKPGMTIGINGVGFTKEKNTFSIGNQKIEDIACQSSVYCEFELPNVSKGIKDIYLENPSGSSKKQKYHAKINIVDNPKPASKIETISPEKIYINDLEQEIILSGEGFAKTGNYINAPFGQIGPVNSDGNKIAFRFKDFSGVDSFVENLKQVKQKFTFNNVGVTMIFMVENEYGVSNFVTVPLE
jgi:peptidoglycan hydrolase-like protein with peptidoglycan-binding domain